MSLNLKCFLRLSVALVMFSITSLTLAASLTAPAEVNVHVPLGTHLLDYQAADLNSDGRQDAIIVVGKSTEGNTLDHDPRTVIVLLRNEKGALEMTALNREVYLCKKCLGSGIVNEQVLTASEGAFSVFNQGGSPRYRWTKEYTFRYKAKANTWILARVKTSIIDTTNNERSRSKLRTYPKNLPEIKFLQFIPSSNWDSKL